MPEALIVVVAILCICVVFVLLLIKRSPEGHEDREGFHGGPTEPRMKSKPPAESQSTASSSPAAPVAGKK